MIQIDKAISLAEKNRLKFVIPPAFPWAPGHYIHDVHNFFLQLESARSDNRLTYLYPFHEAQIPQVIYEIIKEHVKHKYPNVQIVIDNNLVKDVNQIALIYPEYTICPNSPISRLKLPKGVSREDCRIGPSLFGARHFIIPTHEEQKWVVNYLKNAQLNYSCNPFYESLSNISLPLPNRLIDKKLALLQIKTQQANAGLPTDYKDYLPLVEYLQDNGYLIVIAGREDHSGQQIFNHAYHYSISDEANFFYDISLFANAAISVVGGSGIGIIPGVLRKPFILNNHATYLPPQSLYGCINLPAIVYSRSLNRFLSVSETDRLWSCLPDSWEVKPDKYTLGSRGGNPYTQLFQTGEYTAYTNLSNQCLVEAVQMANHNENRVGSNLVSSFTRFARSKASYPYSFVGLLASYDLLR